MPYDEDTDYKRELPEGAPLPDERKPLHTYPNVYATGIGLRRRNGELTDERVVRVYVDTKLEEGDLEAGEKIPDEWLGMPTDVIEEERPTEDVVEAGDEQITDEGHSVSTWGRGERNEPVSHDDFKYAASSRITSYNPTASDAGGGSCWPMMKDANNGNMRVMITNRHVAANTSSDGDGETASEVIDDNLGLVHDAQYTNTDRIGVFRDCEVARDSGGNVDAAYFDVDPEVGCDASPHVWAGPKIAPRPSDGWPAPELGRRYVNFGAKTGITEGICEDVDYQYDTWGETTVKYENYGNAGDSGSLTARVNENGKLEPVGLHHAGSDTSSLAFDINDVEYHMGWELHPVDSPNEPDYTAIDGTGHIEMTPYNTTDNGDGTLAVKAIVANSGGSERSKTVEIRDDADSSVLASQTVTMAAGEHQLLEFTISDTWLGSVLYIEDDMQNADEWGASDGDGLYDRHREFTAKDEAEIGGETDSATGELKLGQFKLGQQSLGGREITQINATATASSSVTASAGATVVAPSGSVKNAAATAKAQGNATAIADHIEFIPDSEFWLIDGQRIDDVVTEERRWQELTLVARTSGATVKNDIRPNMENAGKYEIHETATGGYVAADDANGGNTIQLASPVARRDVRAVTKWVVDEYDEEQLDQGGDEYKVAIKAVPLESKETDGTYPSQTRATNEWAFAFANGTFTTRKASADLADRGKEGDREKELTLLLDTTQMMTLEDHASRLNAVKRREIPGEQNVAVDTSPDSRNTVTITPPDGTTDVFASGDYVVTGWSTETLGDDTYRTTVTLLPAG